MNTNKTTAQLLLQHGLDLVAEKGLRGLTVRELAARANVNLGSFVYHFSTRERFVTELVELWYAPIYHELQKTASSPMPLDTMQKLRVAFTQLLQFFSQNAPFIAHLVADAAAGEAVARAFIMTLPERHPKLLLQLISAAQIDGCIIREPPIHLLMFIMGSAGVPMLLVQGMLHDKSWLPAEAMRLTQLMQDPAAAQLRLQWALRGISTTPGDLAC